MTTKRTEMEEKIAQAKEHYKISVDGWSHIYDEALNDLKFVYDVDDGQWPSKIKDQRVRDGRPIVTVNKLQKFVRQLRGDLQQNRPSVKVIPVDNSGDVNMAELYNGIIREIEYLSSADIAYDTAYMHAVSSSFGFFRLITKYVKGKFEQDVLIRRVLNPFSVHFDPSAVEFTMEDARYCFVEELIDKKEYTRKYPKSDFTDFDGNKTLYGDWLYNDKVRVAEYFYKKPVETELVQLNTGEIIELGDDITVKKIKSLGGIISNQRVQNDHIVKWAKMSGAEILEESTWAGQYIPIIPVFGDEVVADGKKYYLSLARGAKGPQEMYNYWATAATETVALAPKSPYMVDHKQIKGFEGEWESANTENRMYIRYNAIQGLNKPTREPQAAVPTAIMSMMQQSAFDIEDHLGRYEASKGQASNERSGKAIIARIEQADKGTYTYVDNFRRAVIYCGKQLVDLIPKIYDTPRALLIMGENGEHETVNVNNPVVGPSGEVGVENDLTVGKYDLIATVGAAFGSKRREMVEMLLQTMQYAPGLAMVIAPLAIKYSDFPGAQEVYAKIQGEVEKMEAKDGNNGSK